MDGRSAPIFKGLVFPAGRGKPARRRTATKTEPIARNLGPIGPPPLSSLRRGRYQAAHARRTGPAGVRHGRTVTLESLTYVGLPIGAVILDALVRPRVRAGTGLRMRRAAGLWLLACMSGALFGLFLAVCGNGAVAAVLVLAVQALLVLASNAKHAMLGEPLLFSDLALVGAIFRHPQFYLSAVRLWQRIAVGIVAAGLLAVLAWLSVAAPAPHLLGLALLLAGLAALAILLRLPPWRDLAPLPRAHDDVARLGLWPTLLLHWLRWRESRDPPPPAPIARQTPPGAPGLPPELVVIVQCESFADPVELFAEPALALPALAEARRHACQWGNLEVSGFGAYTMRTEYGVLFGRDEDALGFRRFDPFLTALGEASWALPARLRDHAGAADWRSVFVHPHDMRFYGRDRIMPAAGFAALVGEESFAPPAPGEGRYVGDAAVAGRIVDIARSAPGPSLIYAVTIENHGPWAADGDTAQGELVPGYLRLVRRGDAMLAALVEEMRAMKRPALLVFFGDHRPSIPGASVPGGPRHTPYVMIVIDGEGRIQSADNRRVDLPPAGLHHAILDRVLGAPVIPPAG
ncbi:LTA synthase family protein [Novosphingobium resinovorum]|uniref:LTA synthase family protein n=1 Tax=Novosphingobium resinovorum TaxID=158500 RepID=UPI002ED14809|nr:LTA synthase family protein [Novosphingobium resinovorum]